MRLTATLIRYPRLIRAAFFLLALLFALPVAPVQGEEIVYPKDSKLVTDGYYWVKGNKGVWQTSVPLFVEYVPLSLDLVTIHNLHTPSNWVHLPYTRVPVSLLEPVDDPVAIWVTGYIGIYEKAQKKGTSVVFGAPPGYDDYFPKPSTDVTLDGMASVHSLIVDTSTLQGDKSWVFSQHGISSSFGELRVGGSTSNQRRTTVFQDMDLNTFNSVAVHDYDTLKLDRSNLNALSATISLYDGASLIWDSGGFNRLLAASSITGHSSGASLNLLNLTNGSLYLQSIVGVDAPLTVHMSGASSVSGAGSQMIGGFENVRLFVDGGALTFDDASVTDVFLSVSRGGDLALRGGNVRLTGLDGAGRITVGSGGSNSLNLAAAPGSSSGAFTFTGTYNLNSGSLIVDSYSTLGQPESFSSDYSGLNSLSVTSPSAPGHLRTALDFRYSSLTLDLNGHPLTLALPAGQSSWVEDLYKTGKGALILDGGEYIFNRVRGNLPLSMEVQEGSLALRGGVSLYSYVPGYSLNVQPSARLDIDGGPANLYGNLNVQGEFSLWGGNLTVTGNAGISGPFVYGDGGRLSVTGNLNLSGSTFSANVPHPGIFVVADYGVLYSDFANIPMTTGWQDVSSLVLVHNGQSPAWLNYKQDNRILLAAPGGYNILSFAGNSHPSDVWSNGSPDNWQNPLLAAPPDVAWDNSDSHIAVFGASGVAPYEVKVQGTVNANMLSFLDADWSVSANGNPGDLLILRPFVDDPASPIHAAALNSQAASGTAPRLDIPILVSDTSVPLWKTGGGDLALAAASIDQPTANAYTPRQVLIKEGRLILEHNQALENALIRLDPDAVLALNWKTPGTGTYVYNTLAGSGRLEVLAHTVIPYDNPEFSGAVTVSQGQVLTLYNRAALGQGTGLPGIELALGSTLSFAYNLGGQASIAPLPRSISGEGAVNIETGRTIRLAAGNSYSGGTAIGDSAALILEGPGVGREFTAAGDGNISFGNDAVLRLENGGILRNELIGSGSLTLTGPHIYTLTENPAGHIQNQFTGTAAMEHRFTELILKADSALTGDITPAFGISGQGNLILEGPGRTFDFRGLTGNRYAGGTIVADETTLILDSSTGQIGAGRIWLRNGSHLQLEMNGGDFANDLTGIGQVRLDNGTYRLTGDNRLFSGGIAIPGTLAINAQSEAGQARLILENGAVLQTNAPSLVNGIELEAGTGTLNIQQDLRLSGVITGDGSLTKTGSGTLALTCFDNGYSGMTQVNAGELRMEDARLSGGGALTVHNGAALSGRGGVLGHTTINGKLSVDGLLSFYGERDDDGNLLPGGGTNLTLNAGSSLAFNHGGSLDVTGKLDWGLTGNAVTINLDSLGVHVLAKYGTTTLAGGIAAETEYTVNYNSGQLHNDSAHRLVLENFDQAGRLLLIAMPNGQKIEFWAKDGGGIWNTDGEANWSSVYVPSPTTMETWSTASRAAIFGAAGATPGVVRVQGPVSVSGMFFLTDGWHIAGGPVTLLDLDPADAERYAVISSQGGDVVVGSVLTGSAGLHKSGAGHLTLTASNTYAGNTLVSAGTLELGKVDAAGLGTKIAIEDSATLLLTYRNVATGLPQELTGSGTVEIGGEVLLDRANPSFTGTTRMYGGFADLADAGAFGSGTVLFDDGILRIAGGLTINSPIELRGIATISTLGDNASATLSGGLSGFGSLITSGRGTLVVNGDNTAFHGVTVAGAGTLVAGSDTAFGTDNLIRMESGATFGFSGNRILNNSFTLGGDAYFAVHSAAEDSSLNGVIEGAGSLTKDGAGTLTLTGMNTYTGGTTVNLGTLRSGAAGAFVAGAYTVNGGILDINGNDLAMTFLSGSGGAISLGTAALTVNQTANTTYGGAIQGAGSLIKDGGGILTLSGANDYTGGTTVAAGTLAGDASGLQGNITNNAHVEFTQTSAGTYGGTMGGSGALTKSGAGILTLTGMNTYTGGTTVNLGTLRSGAAGAFVAGAYTVNGGILDVNGHDLTMTSLSGAGGAISLGTAALTVNQAANTTYGGAIQGAGSLTKGGTGILTLSGANSYDGGTSVSGGTLRLEDALLSGGGAVTAGSGAVLAGRGGIVGHTTIAGGGALAVDGLLSFGANLSLNAGSSLVFSHGGSLDVNGSLNWGLTGNSLTVNIDSPGFHLLARYGNTTLAGGAVDTASYTLNYHGADMTNDPNYRVYLENISQVNDLVLAVMPKDQKIEFWAKDSGGLWNVDGEANWNSNYVVSPGVMETWSQDSRVAVFGAAGVTPGELRLDENIAASGLFFLTEGWHVHGGSLELLDMDPFDGANAYAVIGGQGSAVVDSVLTGAAGLHKSGSGPIILKAANTYSGGTLVSAGALALWNRLAAGSGAITIEQAGALLLAYQDTSQPLPNTFRGDGRLAVTGDVLLNRASPDFSGEAWLAGGLLRLAHDNALGGCVLHLDGGVLQLADGLRLDNHLELLGVYNQLEVADGESAEISGPLGGSGGFAKTGSGRLELAGDNSAYSGVSSVAAGILVAGHDLALGRGRITIYDGAALGFNGNRNVANDITISGEAFLEVASGNDSVVSGIISGAGSLTKIGAGTLTLRGANTYGGLTEVRGGALALAGSGRISDALALYDGTTFTTGGNAVPLSRLDVLGAANWQGDLRMPGHVMNFSIPPTMGNGDTMLRVSGAADISDSTVNVGISDAYVPLRIGDTVVLIEAPAGLTGTPGNTTIARWMWGVTQICEADIVKRGNQLLATVIGSRNPQTKALSEGFLAGLSLANQGADLVAGKGVAEAVGAARGAESAGYGIGVFGALSGGWSRYNTGSHVDMSSLSLIAGFAWGTELTPGRLTLGAFFEFGNGSYDTWNAFSNAASVKGRGDMYNIGGGILGRMDFADTGPGRIYAEASGRAGGAHNEYKNGDMRDALGRRARYDSSSAYYGAHLGAGYIWNIAEKASLDLYGKYFWTRQEGDSVKLSTGERVTFKDADSSRLRGGARFAYAVNERVSPYIGAAYEHEFGGKARAATNGFNIDAPSLRGGTGVGEVGLTLKPSKDLPLSFDLGVQGYTGKREGVTGSLQIKWEF